MTKFTEIKTIEDLNKSLANRKYIDVHRSEVLEQMEDTEECDPPVKVEDLLGECRYEKDNDGRVNYNNPTEIVELNEFLNSIITLTNKDCLKWQHVNYERPDSRHPRIVDKYFIDLYSLVFQREYFTKKKVETFKIFYRHFDRTETFARHSFHPKTLVWSTSGEEITDYPILIQELINSIKQNAKRVQEALDKAKDIDEKKKATALTILAKEDLVKLLTER